jgi:hypothetical protein
MAKATDLYAILRAYTNKYNSPYIEIDTFLNFLSKYAAHMVKEHPEWGVWQEETVLKFWNGISEYTEDGRCVLMTDTPEGCIYMPHFYIEKLKEAYKSKDAIEHIPFPSEESLGIIIPGDQLETLNLETDLAPYFDKPAESFLPILKLIFPDATGSALILAPMIPRQLMEVSILKIRYYLGVHGNKEYAVYKLSPQLSGNENFIRDALDQVVVRPLEYLRTMESCGDATWLLWYHFCTLIRSELKKKNEKLPEDIAALEAAYIINTCNSFYKIRAQKEREREIAFRALDLHMEQPPFYFSLKAIAKFTNNKGIPLLEQYSNADLEAYIKRKTTESVNNETPEWLIIQGKNNERWFIQKDKYLPLVTKLIVDIRVQLRHGIIERWTKMIREFQHEAAMDSDTEFDRLLMISAGSLKPFLVHFLEDDKLLLVYEEFEHVHGIIPQTSWIFDKGKLLPANVLFQIKRRDLLMDTKLSLPFWFSVPVFSSIIAFFSKKDKKKKSKSKIQKNHSNIDFEEIEGTNGMNGGDNGVAVSTRDMVTAVKNIRAAIVPQGHTVDSYLKELEGQWGRLLLDNKARENLVTDVKTLVRDNLRQVLRLRKNKITRVTLGETAAGIIAGNPALKSLGGKDALKQYMELYMIKQLLTIKY